MSNLIDSIVRSRSESKIQDLQRDSETKFQDLQRDSESKIQRDSESKIQGDFKYNTRFDAMRVSTSPVKERLSFPEEWIEEVIDSLKQHYSTFPLYSLYGEKQVAYVCRLCTHCSFWTLAMPNPKYKDSTQETETEVERESSAESESSQQQKELTILAAKAHALWLSIITIVDGVFDTAERDMTGVGRNLIEILERVFAGDLIDVKTYFIDAGEKVSNPSSSTFPSTSSSLSSSSTSSSLSSSSTSSSLSSSSTSSSLSSSSTASSLSSSASSSSLSSSSTASSLTARDHLINEMYQCFYATFRYYYQVLAPFRILHPVSFAQVNKWLFRYLEGLAMEPEPMTDMTIYYRHRLIDGAMMCVAWHQVLFMGIEEERVQKEHLKIFELAAMAVSYHNDILSIHRDIDQNVNSMVKCLYARGIEERESLERDGGEDQMGNDTRCLSSIDFLHRGIVEAVALTDEVYRSMNSLYKQLVTSNQEDASFTAEIALAIVEGCHNWANTEDRYRLGNEMLRSVEGKDKLRFEEVFSKLTVPDQISMEWLYSKGKEGKDANKDKRGKSGTKKGDNDGSKARYELEVTAGDPVI